MVDVADVAQSELLIHDPARADAGQAFSLAKLAETPTGPTPIGIFRDVDRPVFRRGATEPATVSQLSDLLFAGDTWTVA